MWDFQRGMFWPLATPEAFIVLGRFTFQAKEGTLLDSRTENPVTSYIEYRLWLEGFSVKYHDLLDI